MQPPIKTAVFPVAGYGTRFLPVTKAAPKEMLPILNRPIIQLAVEEALAAGVKKLIFITSNTKHAVEDYFDSNVELELHLKEKQKFDELAQIRNIVPEEISVIYIRQRRQLGLGHAVWCARESVGNEPFALLLPDDLVVDEAQACLKNMVDAYHHYRTNIIAVERVPRSELSAYGVVDVQAQRSHHCAKVRAIVEKPTMDDAPSDLAVIGRYILQPQIFQILAHQQRGVNGEIQLTDAIATLLASQSVYAYQLQGVRYDCGSPLGYVKAVIDFALKDEVIGMPLQQHLEALLECTP